MYYKCAHYLRLPQPLSSSYFASEVATNTGRHKEVVASAYMKNRSM